MVEAQAAPVSTAAIAAAAGLHENTVREHLERLHADGYLHRERAVSARRGRPAWLWRAVTQDAVAPYAHLAAVLAGTLARTAADPTADARRAGRQWGAAIADGALPAASSAEAGADARAAVVAVMDAQGFAPHDTGDEVLLHRCPLIEAAAQHPDIVCAVHLGMIDGVLAASGRRADARLVPFSAPGVCTLQLRMLP